MFASLHSYLGYTASVGIMHEFHKILFPLFLMTGSSGMAHMMKFTQEQITAAEYGGDKSGKADFLSRTMKLHKEDPEKFTNIDVFTTCITNIGAGSDTTSISLCAVLHALMTHPAAMAKLRAEVEHHVGSDGHISFQNTQKMPFLQACIKEALRLHPATGLPLARIVPKDGAFLAGRHFPAGVSILKFSKCIC